MRKREGLLKVCMWILILSGTANLIIGITQKIWVTAIWGLLLVGAAQNIHTDIRIRKLEIKTGIRNE